MCECVSGSSRFCCPVARCGYITSAYVWCREGRFACKLRGCDLCVWFCAYGTCVCRTWGECTVAVNNSYLLMANQTCGIIDEPLELHACKHQSRCQTLGMHVMKSRPKSWLYEVKAGTNSFCRMMFTIVKHWLLSIGKCDFISSNCNVHEIKKNYLCTSHANHSDTSDDKKWILRQHVVAQWYQ